MPPKRTNNQGQAGKRANTDSSDALPRKRPVPDVPTYEYTTLQAVHQMYPIQEVSKTVNVYGVIIEYRPAVQELIIKDETCERFTLSLNRVEVIKVGAGEERRELKLVPGDIIRIHRLTLYRHDFTRRCPRAHNVVTFNPFNGKGDFCPSYLSNNPTFEAYDHTRVEELTKWNVLQLARPRIQTFEGKAFAITDAAFQVLMVEHMDRDRTALVCWNGFPSEQYRTWPMFERREQLLKALYALKKNFAVGNYTYLDFGRLYDTDKLFYLSAFGPVARRVKPLDIIAVYNLLIKPDKKRTNFFSYLLYSGDSCGKALRICHDKSVLAIMLQKQIRTFTFGVTRPMPANYEQLHDEVYCAEWDSDDTDLEEEVDSQENEDIIARLNRPHQQAARLPPRQFVSPFLKQVHVYSPVPLTTRIELADSDDDNQQPTTSQVNESESSSNINCTHIPFTNAEWSTIGKVLSTKQIAHPLLPIHVPSFAAMISKMPTHEEDKGRLFQVAAKFCRYLPPLQTLSHLRSIATRVECTNADCTLTVGETVEAFLGESEHYRLLDGSIVGKSDATEASSSSKVSKLNADRLVCPRCAQPTCILSPNLSLFLEDYDGGMLIAKLAGEQANRLLDTSTADLSTLHGNVLERIDAIFRYMTHCTKDTSSCSQHICWTLSPQSIAQSKREGEDGGTSRKPHYQYHIVDWSLLPSVSTGTS